MLNYLLQIIDMVVYFFEFENIVVREEEQYEFEIFVCFCCFLEVKGGFFNKYGKILIFIQVIDFYNYCNIIYIQDI